MNTHTAAEPVSYDMLGYLQDSLMQKLLSGQVTRATLRRVYEDHIAKLEAAGLPEPEAQTLFWDAVNAAKTEREDLP